MMVKFPLWYRAAGAVTRKVLEIACQIIRDGTACKELGADYFDERIREAVQKRVVKRLEKLGFRVILELLEAVA